MYIILLNIDENFINAYWWLNYHNLLVAILLMVIDGYFINDHQQLLMVIILMAIGGYFKLYYNY